MDETTFLQRLRGPAVNAPGDTPPFDDDGPAGLRMPPQSTEAEQGLLGGLLLDPASFVRIADAVKEADFYSFNHRLIFAAVAALAGAGVAIDVISVFEQLEREGRVQEVGGLPYLNALVQSVPSASGLPRYAEIIAERAQRRRIIAAADSLAAKAFRFDSSSDVLLDEAKIEFAKLAEARAAGAGRLPLLSLGELREQSHAAPWLVKHVLPADSVGMLYGGSGTFKSFIAIDAALHVAHGLPWLGRRTTQGSVIYIAAEGGSGLWPRICAWHRQRRLPYDQTPLHVVPAAVDLAADAWRVVEAAQARGITPALVIVDTLSQTFPGEENNAGEVAAYFRELGTRFRQLWHCAVLILHHTGHTATERPRGSSAMRANLDFMFGVFRDEKEMLGTVSCAKQKDGEGFGDAVFSLSSVDLGTDEDGDMVKSLVARHLTSAEDVQVAMAAEGKAGRGGNNQVLLRLMQNGMREADLRTQFMKECTGADTPEARRQAWSRARGWGIRAGFFEVAQGIVITLKELP